MEVTRGDSYEYGGGIAQIPLTVSHDASGDKQTNVNMIMATIPRDENLMTSQTPFNHLLDIMQNVWREKADDTVLVVCKCVYLFANRWSILQIVSTFGTFYRINLYTTLPKLCCIVSVRWGGDLAYIFTEMHYTHPHEGTNPNPLQLKAISELHLSCKRNYDWLNPDYCNYLYFQQKWGWNQWITLCSHWYPRKSNPGWFRGRISYCQRNTRVSAAIHY